MGPIVILTAAASFSRPFLSSVCASAPKIICLVAMLGWLLWFGWGGGQRLSRSSDGGKEGKSDEVRKSEERTAGAAVLTADSFPFPLCPFVSCLLTRKRRAAPTPA